MGGQKVVTRWPPAHSRQGRALMHGQLSVSRRKLHLPMTRRNFHLRGPIRTIPAAFESSRDALLFKDACIKALPRPPVAYSSHGAIGMLYSPYFSSYLRLSPKMIGDPPKFTLIKSRLSERVLTIFTFCFISTRRGLSNATGRVENGVRTR